MIPQPAGDPRLYKTFGIRAPSATHFRKATCEEVGCADFQYGWKLRWDVLGEQDRHLITHCGRKYVIDQEWIIFEAGQPCFRFDLHKTRIDRPELFLVKGTHMSLPSGGNVRQHKNAEDWTDDFKNTTQATVDQIERG
jgi:hypothetical protein